MPLERRRKLALLGAFLVGAAAGGLSLALMPPSQHKIGPATMSAKTFLGGPYTVLAVPPLGTVRAATHPVPVSLQMSLAELDIAALQRIIGDPSARVDARTEIEEDLRVAARHVAIRTILLTMVGGAVAGALLPWRRLPDIGLGAAGGLLLGVVLVSSVASTFSIEAFAEPKFSGALTRAPAVLRTLEQQQLSLSSVDSRFETAATRLSELLELVANPVANPREDTVALLHVSDIHSNPLGISVTRELANTFNVDAVIDSGDLTSFGERIEANIARRVAKMDVPYIYVPGNHDSIANQHALDRIDNVHLLHNATFDVRGITIFGWRDPTFTVWDAISTSEANDIRLREGEKIAAALQEKEDVDVLVVHDSRMATASEGLVPLVLSGHTHERNIVEAEETDFLSVGSTGATGLEFFIEGERPYEAEIVYFRGEEAVAVDYITFQALGDDFEIDRQRLED